MCQKLQIKPKYILKNPKPEPQTVHTNKIKLTCFLPQMSKIIDDIVEKDGSIKQYRLRSTRMNAALSIFQLNAVKRKGIFLSQKTDSQSLSA